MQDWWNYFYPKQKKMRLRQIYALKKVHDYGYLYTNKVINLVDISDEFEWIYEHNRTWDTMMHYFFEVVSQDPDDIPEVINNLEEDWFDVEVVLLGSKKLYLYFQWCQLLKDTVGEEIFITLATKFSYDNINTYIEHILGSSSGDTTTVSHEGTYFLFSYLYNDGFCIPSFGIVEYCCKLFKLLPLAMKELENLLQKHNIYKEDGEYAGLVFK